jgi:hypothetical protein
MIITYKVHRAIYTADGKQKVAEFIIHAVNTNTKIGRDVKDIFQDNNRFYVGGIYAGCEILSITNSEVIK